MHLDTISFEQTGEATWIDIDWPGVTGEIRDGLIADLDEALNLIEDDGSRSLVVWRGLGRDRNGQPPAPELDQCRKWEATITRIERLAALSLAVIDGVCQSSSLQLALACDLRLATDRSRIQLPAVKAGFLPGMSTFRLAKYTGLGVARRLVLAGEPLGAVEALNFGLIDRVCAPPELEERTSEAVAALATVDGRVVQLARRLLNESFATAFEDAIGHYLAAQHHCLSRLPEEPAPPGSGGEDHDRRPMVDRAPDEPARGS